MSFINRITNWVAGQTLTAAALNGEFNNITNLINNVDAGTTPWDNVNSAVFKRSGVQVAPILQLITFISNSGVSTTSSNFTSSNLTASITPGSTSNKILIFASGTLLSATQTNTAYMSLFRGTTDLSGGSGFQELVGATSGSMSVPCTAIFLDSPATTSSTTYTVKIKSGDNTHTVTFGDTNVTQTIYLVELGY